MTLDDEDKETLAAEYALGTLDPDERAEAQALIAADRELGTSVRQWERWLGELRWRNHVIAFLYKFFRKNAL